MSTMPQTVPTFDLSTIGVGQQTNISLNATLAKVPYDAGTSEGNPYHIRIYNDSGSTLQLWNDTGSINDYIPAGAWPTYDLEFGSRSINIKVVSILPNPPIQLLMMTIWGPSETVPETPQLGNSPVGIGGSVQTSSVQTLSNEGNPKTQLVIDVGDSALAQLITINNDGTATWKVDVTSVAHTILAIAATGNLLKLGQAGDVVEALGKLTVDQLLTAAAGLNITASGLTVTGGIATDTFNSSGNATVGGSILTNTIRDNATGADQIDLATAGATVNNLINLKGGAQLGSAGNDFVASGETGNNKILDCTSGVNIFINPPATGAGRVIGFATNATDRMEIGDTGLTLKNGSVITLLAGSVQRMTGANNTTAGSGTVITHGLGAIPNYVSWMLIIAQPGSGSNGVGSIGSTTFTGTVGAGTAATWSTKL